MADIVPVVNELKSTFAERTTAKNIDPSAEKAEADKTPNILSLFDAFVLECGRQNDWSQSTLAKFASVKNHLMEFNKKASFDSFDESGIIRYV